MHLRQPEFTYSACEPFTINKERIQTLQKQVIDNIFIKTNQIKLVFNNDTAYGNLKDLTRRTDSDKLLLDKTFNIAKNTKYDGH